MIEFCHKWENLLAYCMCGAGLLVATTVVVTVLFKWNVINFEALRAEASTCRSLIRNIAFLVACLIALGFLIKYVNHASEQQGIIGWQKWLAYGLSYMDFSWSLIQLGFLTALLVFLRDLKTYKVRILWGRGFFLLVLLLFAGRVHFVAILDYLYII